MKNHFIYAAVLSVIFAQTISHERYLSPQQQFTSQDLQAHFEELSRKSTAIRALPAECGTIRGSQYFNLERTIAPNEFPWMATIIRRDTSNQYLGVLITQQYILTLANLISQDLNASLVIVFLGSCRLNETCKVSYEVDLMMQPHEGPTEIATINMMRLKAPVIFTDDISPICLPTSDVSSITFVGQHLLMAGRLRTGFHNSKFFVLIQPISSCPSTFLQFRSNNDSKMICASTCDNGSQFSAGSALMGVALKDSMIHHYYLVGLLLGGMNGCYDNTPDFFQRIDQYVDWIQRAIETVERDKVWRS